MMRTAGKRMTDYLLVQACFLDEAAAREADALSDK